MKRVLLGMLIFGGAALLGGCPIYPDDSHYRTCGRRVLHVVRLRVGLYVQLVQGQCVYTGYPDYDASAPDNGPCGLCPHGDVLHGRGRRGAVSAPHLGGRRRGLRAARRLVERGRRRQPGAGRGVRRRCGRRRDHERPVQRGLRSAARSPAASASTASARRRVSSAPTGRSAWPRATLCVDGVCVPPCGHCPQRARTGYACDSTARRMQRQPGPLLRGLAVPGRRRVRRGRGASRRARSPDAGAQCGSGQVCVNGGCIPDQRARFTCHNDGQRGDARQHVRPLEHLPARRLLPGLRRRRRRVRLRRDVQVGQDQQGTYSVCAPASNLGSDCNPAVGAYCARPADAAAAPVCVNGYCE